MKRIGLIGGVSPESTIAYYRLLNAAARNAYGSEYSADLIVHSLNYGFMRTLYDAADWDTFKATVIAAGRGLAAAGCDTLAISSNTVQMAVYDLADAIDIPVIFLLDALADALEKAHIEKPLLLGTRFTMEGFFYKPSLQERHGVSVITPNAEDRALVDRIIFDELCDGGVIRETSRKAYLDVIERGRAAGADAVILGCTEIGLLIDQSHTDLPVFDTTLLHTGLIADYAFAGGC